MMGLLVTIGLVLTPGATADGAPSLTGSITLNRAIDFVDNSDPNVPVTDVGSESLTLDLGTLTLNETAVVPMSGHLDFTETVGEGSPQYVGAYSGSGFTDVTLSGGNGSGYDLSVTNAVGSVPIPGQETESYGDPYVVDTAGWSLVFDLSGLQAVNNKIVYDTSLPEWFDSPDQFFQAGGPDYDLDPSHPPIANIALTLTPSVPVAVDDTLLLTSRKGAKTINVLSNDTDPSGYTLSVTGVTKPAHGTIRCTSVGACTYTPGRTFPGHDSVQYTVSDGHGGVAKARMKIRDQRAPIAVYKQAQSTNVTVNGKPDKSCFTYDIYIPVYKSTSETSIVAKYDDNIKWCPTRGQLKGGKLVTRVTSKDSLTDKKSNVHWVHHNAGESVDDELVYNTTLGSIFGDSHCSFSFTFAPYGSTLLIDTDGSGDWGSEGVDF
jgi:hypothetical protein